MELDEQNIKLEKAYQTLMNHFGKMSLTDITDGILIKAFFNLQYVKELREVSFKEVCDYFYKKRKEQSEQQDLDEFGVKIFKKEKDPYHY